MITQPSPWDGRWTGSPIQISTRLTDSLRLGYMQII